MATGYITGTTLSGKAGDAPRYPALEADTLRPGYEGSKLNKNTSQAEITFRSQLQPSYQLHCIRKQTLLGWNNGQQMTALELLIPCVFETCSKGGQYLLVGQEHLTTPGAMALALSSASSHDDMIRSETAIKTHWRMWESDCNRSWGYRCHLATRLLIEDWLAV